MNIGLARYEYLRDQAVYTILGVAALKMAQLLTHSNYDASVLNAHDYVCGRDFGVD